MSALFCSGEDILSALMEQFKRKERCTMMEKRGRKIVPNPPYDFAERDQ
jgi:hypothetical protein